MEFIINGKSQVIPHTSFQYAEFERQVQAIAAEEQLIFSHLLINGQEVYEDFERIIDANLSEQLKLEAVFSTRDEYRSDLLSSMHRYLQQIEPAVQSLSQKFHQQPNAADWDSFAQLMEGVQWLLSASQQVTELSGGQLPSLAECCNMLADHARALNQAMNPLDTTLIGDLLAYEFLPLFQRMRDSIDRQINGGAVSV